MDNWFTSLIQVIGGLLALLLLVGVVWAVVRGSFNKATAEKLRTDIADGDRRLKIAEHDLELEKGKTAALEAKVEGQAQQILDLREMVTQRAKVEILEVTLGEMLTELREHHRVALDHWTRMEGKFDA